MRTRGAVLLLLVLALGQFGCATGFRASGPKGGGVSAGAAVGTSPPPLMIQEGAYLPLVDATAPSSSPAAVMP